MSGRILLINPGHDGDHAVHKSHRRVHRDPPPLGLLYVGTALLVAGYDVDILDTHVDADWHATLGGLLADHSYLWAGLTCIIGQRQRNAYEVTRILKDARPRMPVVWGGTMPTVFGVKLKEAYPLVDKVVHGEGETWAVNYTDILADASPDDPVARSLYPAWPLFGERYNKQQVPYFHMLMTSRGCPMKCTFCYKHTATGGYRLMPLDDVKRQMMAMHEQTGGRVWTIGDDNFLGDTRRAMQLLRWMKERGFYFEEVIGHIGRLTEYVADAMEGVVSTFIFSVESASPRLQDLVQKGVVTENVPMKMGWLAKRGIVANCSFIFGLPTETEAERRENWELMRRIREQNDMVRGVSYVYFPLPETPMLDTIERKCGVSARWPVKDYEDANFWPEAGDCGAKFRPWLSENEYADIVADAVRFREEWRFPRPAPYRLDEVLGVKE